MKQIARITWKSPSNIAFIKYWGKYGNQFPQNPSLSMTLTNCYTITEITLLNKTVKNGEIEFLFRFENEENQLFNERINNYLVSIKERVPSISRFALQIDSQNSFPHSAGIASSASSMSALALCLATIENRLGKVINEDLYKEASVLARMGSGSASRSIYGKYSTWGKIHENDETSNEFASPLSFGVADIFNNLNDSILIIDKSQKPVSSSAGHALMNNHPYAKQRFLAARKNLRDLLIVLKNGNFNEFSRIIETEALSLHALMMTAEPWYTLLAPNSLQAIQTIKDFRERTGTRITFTLDAGPNVHVIYPKEEEDKVKKFIANELLYLCAEEEIIHDRIGYGPELLVDEFIA